MDSHDLLAVPCQPSSRGSQELCCRRRGGSDRWLSLADRCCSGKLSSLSNGKATTDTTACYVCHELIWYGT